ncbi:glycosyltransferase [Salmonella enterica]|nr:glycosyltransferase [Salmonella enterica]ECJ2310001.1 glycosyltransferase [Salmonella enterica subsp. arizonae]EEE2583683.1 glycosyltransferase [Salmonella enterica subsp. arizonae serovar 56:z4,z23:-]EJU7780571.1 glycosyltransferase [Salmonella enterica subsp. arizonae serovar 56:z36:-]EAX9063652.1 glycosyltransferase [Salmonella enterica]
MKLSVCVSTYNQEKYIKSCLESIDNQNINIPFDIIVGVDKSSDNTLKIVYEYQKISKNKVVIVTSDEQVGASENYLRIHKRACGEFVSHIDGDDLMLPGKLSQQVKILENSPHLSAVWHNMILFSDSGEVLNPAYASVWDGEITLKDFIRVGFVAAHSSIMYRKKCRNTYNYNYPVPDYAIFLDLLNQGNGYVINEPLGMYRHNITGGTINTGLETFKANVYRALYDFALTKKNGVIRKEIFCFALLNLLADLKSRRKIDNKLLRLLTRNASFIEINLLIDSYRKMIRTSVRKA